MSMWVVGEVEAGAGVVYSFIESVIVAREIARRRNQDTPC